MKEIPLRYNVIQLFRALNSLGVVYCHWKSNEHLREGLTGETDLDVLVSKVYRSEFETAAHERGFIQFKSQFGSRYIDVEDWIGMDFDSGSLIHIHLHYRMATGHAGMKEYSLPWAEVVLSQRIMMRPYPVFVCPPDYEMLCLYCRIALKGKLSDYLRSLFGKYRIKDADLREIEFLRKRVNTNSLMNLCRKSFTNGDSIFNIINNTALNGHYLFLLKKLIRSDMNRYRVYRGVRCAIYRVYYYLMVEMRGILKRKFGFCLITKKTL